MNEIDPRIIKALRILSDRIERHIYLSVEISGRLTEMIPKQECLDREWLEIDNILKETI